MAMHNPPYPGEFIAEVYLEPNNLSARELAAKLSVSYIEAWQYQFVGSERSELFVGCLPIKDKGVLEAAEVHEFEFRENDAVSIYLNMKLYDAARTSRAHSMKISFSFFQSVDY